MKTIKLTQDKYALVDDSDFEELSNFKWFTFNSKNKFYARRNVQLKFKRTHELMHQRIMGKAPKGKVIDHIDGDGLNNQRKNLRFCTFAQNSQNRGKQITNTSGFPNVYWDKRNRSWTSTCTINKKTFYIYANRDKEKVIKAYKEFVKDNEFIRIK